VIGDDSPTMTARDIDSPDIRSCGSELLSLALMDARNHTLHLLGLFEAAAAEGKLAASPVRGMDPPWWVAGHLGWFAEAWISRNPQRSLGPACPTQPLRLASIEPEADRWWSPALAPADQRWAMELPDAGTVRAWLLETLETTLDLLARTPEDDAALYFYRLALFHEDLRGEQLIALAQTLGLPLKLALPGGVAPREPLRVPATRWTLGARPDAQPSGFVWDQDKWAHPVDVPEFEIDAQPVTWAQMVEFVDDGGYDRPELWHPDGWAWLQQLAEGEGRRGPRHVEQIGVASGAVMQTLFGKPVRMSGSQSANGSLSRLHRRRRPGRNGRQDPAAGADAGSALSQAAGPSSWASWWPRWPTTRWPDAVGAWVARAGIRMCCAG
jgi:iron(II)-dependent oxidoreductase